MEMKPIGWIRSDFESKFGIPRQSGVVEELQAQVIFDPEYRVREAFRGLEGFSHLWLLWEFSESVRENWSPTVRPPRLGGNRRMGVFATRSPFRPNPIGLSCVRLERVELDSPDGPVLHVLGADLLNGTPIFDIKPYLPYTDCRPEAVGGFAPDYDKNRLTVEFPPSLASKVQGEKLPALTNLLAGDPRPSYQKDPDRVYGMTFAGQEIKFSVEENILRVVSVENRKSKNALEIRDYTPDFEKWWIQQFVRYAKEDLQDTNLSEEILREKIARGVFLKNQETGVSSIALVFYEETPAGFAVYQVDSPEADWCKRPGWGLIREFCILPEFRGNGFGKALAGYAERKLFEKTDRLYLTAHDEGAGAFWTACGFTDTGEDDPNGCRIFEKKK